MLNVVCGTSNDESAALALDQIVRSPRARALGWTPSLHSVAGNAARLFDEWRRKETATETT
jgi:hypothetical protein